MASSKFLNSVGFVSNPFEETNADREDDLQQYFVPPPYFTSLIGDPKKPKTSMVFAPRGAGKTAQKVSIERLAINNSSNFLCISYDEFKFIPLQSLDDANSDWHLKNILKKIVFSILLTLEGDSNKIEKIGSADKSFLGEISISLFNEMGEPEFDRLSKSIRTMKSEMARFVGKHGRTASVVSNAFLTYFRLPNIEVNKREIKSDILQLYIERCIQISKFLGYASVYILVDRIDEHNLTSASGRDSFKFISSLISNLHFLETDGLAFKFFLWDDIKIHFTSTGQARFDRIDKFDIFWSNSEISEMLAKRIKHFSNGKIESFNSLMDSGNAIDVHKLISYLSYGSPRDAVRFCKEIIQEHIKESDTEQKIVWRTAEHAIKKFCQEKHEEIFRNYSKSIVKLGKIEFDESELSIEEEGKTFEELINRKAISRILRKLDTPDESNSIIRISDPRTVVCLHPKEEQLLKIIRRYMHLCPSCDTINILEEPSNYNLLFADQHSCSGCPSKILNSRNNLAQAVFEA